MKTFLNFFFAALLGVFVLAACNDDKDDCYTCSISFFGIESKSEFCDDGTDMTDVTTTILGISVDTTVGLSAQDYMTALETAGYSCKKD